MSTFKKFFRRNKYFIVFLITIIVVSGCSEIFEDDISESSVTIISPVDNYVSNSTQLVLWWNEIDGADWYHIQVVSPSFDSVQCLHIDSNAIGENMTFSGSAGKYSWRIRPENSAYQGLYVYSSFEIDTSSTN